MMAEKPILFSTPMARAILDGRKTMTRRLIKPQPEYRPWKNDSFGIPYWKWRDCQWIGGGLGMPESAVEDYAPYRVGDVLWVRETWAFQACSDCTSADDANIGALCQFNNSEGQHGCYHFKNEGLACRAQKRKPSIHMPRAAARLFLRVTGVRAERLQDISEADAKAEGIRSFWLHMDGGASADDWRESNGSFFGGTRTYATRREAFGELWDSLNAKRGDGAYVWAANPWVWVVEFERIGVK